MAQRSPRAAAALLLFGTGAAAAYSHRPISCQEASSPCSKCKLDNTLVLAGDIGGTNSRLKLYCVDPQAAILKGEPAPGAVVFEAKYSNIQYKSLEEVVEHFLLEYAAYAGGKQSARPAVACLAVAGVVTENRCRLTNVDWTVDGDAIAASTGMRHVEVINDFVAQGYGILTLRPAEVVCLHEAPRNSSAPIACLGAGTGLGECFLTPDGDGEYTCFPSEGGHAEWAPRGEGSEIKQIELLKWLKIKFSGWNRISVERVASGPGISNIYEFLAYNEPSKINRKVHREFLKSKMAPHVVTMNAAESVLCDEALQIFCACYGAETGVLGLKYMPFGGLYLSGGVTARLLDRLIKEPEFMDAYWDKGRVSPLLSRVPLYVINAGIEMGERGAHLRAVKVLRKCPEKHQPQPVPPAQLVPPRSTTLADLNNNNSELRSTTTTTAEASIWNYSG